MTDLLEQKLEALYNNNQPDEQFADQLEQQLRAMYKQQPTSANPVPNRSSNKFIRWVATIAASIVIIAFAFTAVPPLRSLAEELIQFFVPGNNYVLSGDEEAYKDAVMVDTVGEAETIAGFEALEWIDDGFNIISISAANEYIHITYERENDRGVLMHIMKWQTDTRPEQHPIDPEAESIATTVNGVPAEFVAGAWFGETPDWETSHYRQLRWDTDGFSYRLLVSSPIASTLEQTLQIAEALR